MSQEVPFEIKNYRLLGIVDENRISQLNPNNIFLYNQRKYQLSESFGTVYIGTDIITVGNIRFRKEGQTLDYLHVDFSVVLEKYKKEVTSNRMTFNNVDCNSLVQVPTEIKLENTDNYIFTYKFTYKEKPFLTGSQIQIQEEKWHKKFRIQPNLPFEIAAPKLYLSLAPIYLLEYQFKNVSGDKLNLKDISFKTELPFEAQKITSPSSGNQQIALLNQEEENIIFKITVKPDQIKNYQNLFKSIQFSKEKLINIGSLKLQWGSCGKYQGQTVHLEIMNNDIAVELCEEDKNQNKSYQLEEIQQVKVKIYSPTQKNLSLKVYLKESEMDAVKTIGTDQQHIEINQAKPTAELTLFIVPAWAGVQQIKGLYFVNPSQNVLMFKNNLQIMITPSLKNIPSQVQQENQQQQLSEQVELI